MREIQILVISVGYCVLISDKILWGFFLSTCSSHGLCGKRRLPRIEYPSHSSSHYMHMAIFHWPVGMSAAVVVRPLHTIYNPERRLARGVHRALQERVVTASLAVDMLNFPRHVDNFGGTEMRGEQLTMFSIYD